MLRCGDTVAGLPLGYRLAGDAEDSGDLGLPDTSGPALPHGPARREIRADGGHKG